MGSAAGIALILLALNLAVLVAWMVQLASAERADYNFTEIAASLTRQADGFVLSETGAQMIHAQYQWAMLLGDDGSVLWSESLPADFPARFSVPEVASFSRWYLGDYPVHVWRHPGGLLVLGSPPGSTWKHAIEMPEAVIDIVPAWFGYALLINVAAAILLALLFGLRMFRSLRPLIHGIADLAENRPVDLSTRGLLGDLAEKLNQTSLQLRKQEAALQKRDNARTTWIAGVSHDIRTPLSMVMGYASQLEENPRLPQAERLQAGIIRRQSEKIKTLVSDLNLASKLEYDMQPLRLAAVYPAVLARDLVTELLNSQLEDCYTIDLHVAEDAQGARITGDEALLRRALFNLIDNSMRHNPEGCAIRLAVARDAADCLISVCDDGSGLPAEVLESLRNPADPASIGGHGLGLTIVRQIAGAHGGAAEFSRSPNAACQAVLRLPLAEPGE